MRFNIFFAFRVCLLHNYEWDYLSNNYNFDQAISVQKIDSETFLFEPVACESCIREIENSKFYFENKKILIRQKDDGTDDVQIIETVDSCSDFRPVIIITSLKYY